MGHNPVHFAAVAVAVDTNDRNLAATAGIRPVSPAGLLYCSAPVHAR